MELLWCPVGEALNVVSRDCNLLAKLRAQREQLLATRTASRSGTHSLSRPLNDSMNAFCCGLPGAM